MTAKYFIPEYKKEEVCAALLHYGLLKYDPTANLPLTSGGRTDLYIDIRNVRNIPYGAEYIRAIFEQAFCLIIKVIPDRFLEIPHSMSGVVGVLSKEMNVPYITFSEKKIYGEGKAGETVFIIDDVITDGESKVAAIKWCREQGLNVSVAVLVDRQQGWQENFKKHGLEDVKVHAGMTLDDIREIIADKSVVSTAKAP